jgi:hypothetical protein
MLRTSVTFETAFMAPLDFAHPTFVNRTSLLNKRSFYTIFLLKRIHSFYFQIFKHALVYT